MVLSVLSWYRGTSLSAAELDARRELVLSRQTELGLELEVCLGREHEQQDDVLDFYIWNGMFYL